MAFTVITYKSEDQLAAAIQAVVTTYPDEDSLDIGIEGSTDITSIVVVGNKYTLIDNAQITNVSIRILAKGRFYTVILETV